MNLSRCSILRALVVAAGAVLALPRVAQAHLGPPFPVITDQPVPGYKLTVLTNPDTTQAVAYVVLERTKTGSAPDVASVDLWIQPLDHHASRASYDTTKEFSRDSLRFYAQPNFDQVGKWYLGANVHFANGVTYRFITNVDATPPGIGRWGLLLFAAPLLAFGVLFVLVVSRRKRARAQRRTPRCVAKPVARTGPSASVAEPRNEPFRTP